METKRCKQGKHRFRENSFGVVWCIDCGMFSNTLNAPKLEKSKESKK